MTTIDDVIARIPDWQGSDIRAVPLAGGLTNSNYRVDVDGVAYVVRIPGQSTELLSVNREHEYHNTSAAAQAGVGARIAHYLPDIPVMVLEFIPGPTMSGERLRDPAMIPQIARSVRMLHAGPRFINDFNMFRTMDFYLGIVQQHGFRIPDGYLDYVPIARRIEAALAVRPLPLAALQQRSAGRELYRRRPDAAPGRLRVQRQQRPLLRAWQHLQRERLPARAGRAALRGLLRPGQPR